MRRTAENWSDVTVTRFLSCNAGEGILNKLKAGQISYRSASEEGVAIVEA